MPHQKHFVFVSLDGMTDPLGQSQVLPYLIELKKQGYHISIASCEKKENFTQNKSVIDGLTQQHGINWHYCFYKTGKPFISPFKNYQALKVLVKKIILSDNQSTSLLKTEAAHVILHCRSYIPGLIGLSFKKQFGTGFIFDMRGFWADERIEGGIWKKSNPIANIAYRFFKRKENDLLQQADAIISLTQKAKDIILNWPLGIKAEKISVIPCCADLNHFSNTNIKAEEFEIYQQKFPQFKTKFVLSYVGSLGTWYMAKEMLQFFKEFDALKESCFLIITKDEPSIILKEAVQLGIDVSKLSIVSANRQQIPYYIKLSQASVFFIRPSFSKQASSPTKMGELLSMGIPLVINSGVGDTQAVVEQYKCGVVVNEFNKDAYQSAAKKLLNSLEDFKNQTEPTAQACFSLQEGVKRYQEVYNLF